jgi:hypothetical protein
MLNSTPNEPEQSDVDRIVREGPGGAVVLAGIATLIVVLIWFAFYLFVFSPRALP